MHGTINSNRYYGMFETIRKGAEIYYRETKRNYFNDFTLLHDMLNLTLVHKNSLLVYSLTPKKDYDVTILSQNFGEDVIELLYAVLQSNFLKNKLNLNLKLTKHISTIWKYIHFRCPFIFHLWIAHKMDAFQFISNSFQEEIFLR